MTLQRLYHILPDCFLRKVAAALGRWISWRVARADSRSYHSSLAERQDDSTAPLFIIDGCHGGIPFWDWIVIRGGMWLLYFWPVAVRALVTRAIRFGFSSVLELDGYTYAVMAASSRDILKELDSGLRNGKIEIVNGTYSQPFLQTISAESALRQYSEGLKAIVMATGTRVTSYLTQEPGFCVQSPQILSGFGFEQALLRTHWAAFGTECAVDETVVNWIGPDGSSICTVPRYSSLDYSRLMNDPMHTGIAAGGLTATASGRLDLRELEEFRAKSIRRGISEPVMTQSVDVFEGPTSMSVLARLRPVTLREYVSSVRREVRELRDISLSQDDLPSTLPWGLEGDLLPRVRAQTESLLLRAENADANHWWQTGKTHEERLRQAWRDLLLAQHHDLQVCGMWLSRKHQAPMSSVGLDLCRNAEQVAMEVLASCNEPALDSWNHESVLTWKTEVHPDGTFTIVLDGHPIVHRGGFFTVWRDGTCHDSRSDERFVREVSEGHWEVVGSVGGIRYWQTIAIGRRVEVEVAFDFGAGMHFGPQEPSPGYYSSGQQKLCAVFPTSASTVVRDSPFYFEATKAEDFGAISWVGLENDAGEGIAILSPSACGYHYDRAEPSLRRVIAWAPRSWLYDSDDSISRNGTKFTAIRGKHAFRYAIEPYLDRAQAAQIASEYATPFPKWIEVTPKDVVVTAVFVYENQMYIRLWNPTAGDLLARVEAPDNAALHAVRLGLDQPEPVDGRNFLLHPWGVQTLLITRR